MNSADAVGNQRGIKILPTSLLGLAICSTWYVKISRKEKARQKLCQAQKTDDDGLL
jgi:hypothetical protein